MTLTNTERNDISAFLCELYAYAFTGQYDAIVDTLSDLERVLGVVARDDDVQDLIGLMS
jgi:hypothetical protein